VSTAKSTTSHFARSDAAQWLHRLAEALATLGPIVELLCAVFGSA